MDQPCENLQVGHLALAVINAAQAIAIAWLVNRRWQADKRDNSNGKVKLDQLVHDQKVLDARRVRERNSEEP
jgi:hypothetical protein